MDEEDQANEVGDDHSSEGDEADDSSSANSEQCSCVDVVGTGDALSTNEYTEVVDEYTEAGDLNICIDHDMAALQGNIRNIIECNTDRAIDASNDQEQGAEQQRARLEQIMLEIDRKVSNVLVAQAQIQVQQRCLNDMYSQQQNDMLEARNEMLQAAADGKKLVIDSYYRLAAVQNRSLDNIAATNNRSFEIINRSLDDLTAAHIRSHDNTKAMHEQHNRLLDDIAAAQRRPLDNQVAAQYCPLDNTTEGSKRRHIIVADRPINQQQTNNQQQKQQCNDDNDRKRRRIIVYEQPRQQQQQIAMKKHIDKLDKSGK